MPIIYWLFSGAFIAGAARWVIGSLGFGILAVSISTAFIYNIKNAFTDMTNGGTGPGGVLLQYMLENCGVAEGLGFILSAFTVRISLATLKRLAMIG